MAEQHPIPLELLAPARDKATALAALACGADAIYIGAPSHGARAAAAVSIEDIAAVAAEAHRFRARVFVALNTLIYDDEIADVERMIHRLYRAGADALIIQDMAITTMDLPPIALHASTQTDIRTAERAAEMAAMGMTRIVVARELSIAETEAIHRAVPGVEIEAFVHGALCVSFSGDCRASYAATGRSANRGECSQMCRHAYTLRDGNGHTLLADSHILSLRDLNRSSRLAEMAAAGVTSFKIEGRLKDEVYVKETVAFYSRLLDSLVASSEGRYCRASVGRVTLDFIPDPARAFNRGFTQYFTSGIPPKGLNLRMATLERPGSTGEEVGTVATTLPRGGLRLALRPGIEIATGDGLSYTDPATGREEGFRVNRAEGRDIFLPPGTPLPARGAILRRTLDSGRQRLLARPDIASRTLPLSITLRLTASGHIAAEARDILRGFTVSVASDERYAETAASPQTGRRRQPFEKLGGTIYTLDTFADDIDPQIFIPASALTPLRRRLIETIDRTAACRYQPPRPRRRDPNATIGGGNIANARARSLSPSGTEAAETRHPDGRGMTGERVMTTRYCIRRELGRCLATPRGREWRGPLTIADASGNTFRLDFDCARCQMNVVFLGKKPSPRR